MAIEAKARVFIQGGSQTLRTIQGIQQATRATGNESKRQAREQEKAAQRSAREQEKAARQKLRAEERSAREQQRLAKQTADKQIREAGRAAREIERFQDREARRWRKLAEESVRVREQAEQRTQRTRERLNSRAVRSGLRFVGAATAGVLAGGIAASSQARGIAGVADVGTRIQRANTFQESLIITGTQAGVSKERRKEIQGQVLSAAQQSATDPLELAGALEVAQKQFNGFERFANIIGELAVTAKAGGADVAELTTALGYIQQAFGLTQEESVEALNLMVAAAAKGSVEIEDFARDFAASAGIFATNTGQTGIEGARQFLGVSQGVATGGFGSAESATRVERFATDLQDAGVQKGLRAIGIKLPKDGKINVGDLLDQLATNKSFKNATKRQQIFKEERSRQAVDALLAARERVKSGTADAVDFDTIKNVDAASGAALTQETFQELDASGALEMQREAVRMQAHTIEKLKEFNDQILFVTKAANNLEQSLGTLSVWAGSIGSAGSGAVGAALLGSLGTTAAAAGAGGGAAVAGGGTMAALASAGWLTSGAALVGSGLAGYYGAKALGADDLGASIGNWFADLIHGPREEQLNKENFDFTKLDGARGTTSSPGTAVAERLNAPVVNELRNVTKELKSLNDKADRRPAPAVNQPARGPR